MTFNNSDYYYYAALLAVIIFIAFYVNRKRDARGRISFIDKNIMGIVSIRLTPVTKMERGKPMLLPVWVPENRLLLAIRIYLKKGPYEIETVWDRSSLKPSEYIFSPLDEDTGIDREFLAEKQVINIPKHMMVEFRVLSDQDRFFIDSPQSDKINTPDGEEILPILIKDPDLKKTAKRLRKVETKKAKRKEIWNLTVTDDGILKNYSNEIRVLKRKMEGLMMKNKELQSNLNQTIQKLKKKI